MNATTKDLATDQGLQGQLSVERIVRNAIMGNSHPCEDGHLMFTCEEEVFNVAEQVALALAATPTAMPEEKEGGQVYGIIDPDYGRIYTIIRKLAWDEGYAIGMHGSFTRDLDLIAVPWEAGNHNAEKLVRRIEASTAGVRSLPSNPGTKPNGRRVWTLVMTEFGDPRFIDLSIMPVITAPDRDGALEEAAQLFDSKAATVKREWGNPNPPPGYPVFMNTHARGEYETLCEHAEEIRKMKTQPMGGAS